MEDLNHWPTNRPDRRRPANLCARLLTLKPIDGRAASHIRFWTVLHQEFQRVRWVFGLQGIGLIGTSVAGSLFSEMV
jgi:hypothetical protein